MKNKIKQSKFSSRKNGLEELELVDLLSEYFGASKKDLKIAFEC